jgi:hypothetical protein
VDRGPRQRSDNLCHGAAVGVGRRPTSTRAGRWVVFGCLLICERQEGCSSSRQSERGDRSDCSMPTSPYPRSWSSRRLNSPSGPRQIRTPSRGTLFGFRGRAAPTGGEPDEGGPDARARHSTAARGIRPGAIRPRRSALCSLGIARDDAEGRRKARLRNWRFYDAPLAGMSACTANCTTSTASHNLWESQFRAVDRVRFEVVRVSGR